MAVSSLAWSAVPRQVALGFLHLPTDRSARAAPGTAHDAQSVGGGVPAPHRALRQGSARRCPDPHGWHTSSANGQRVLGRFQEWKRSPSAPHPRFLRDGVTAFPTLTASSEHHGGGAPRFQGEPNLDELGVMLQRDAAQDLAPCFWLCGWDSPVSLSELHFPHL